jgi:serine/threonine protein kinase
MTIGLRSTAQGKLTLNPDCINEAQAAPELLNWNKDYDYKAQLYAMGCCLFFMRFGRFPERQNYAVWCRQTEFEDDMEVNFLQKLLQLNHKHRYGWLELATHPFLADTSFCEHVLHQPDITASYYRLRIMSTHKPILSDQKIQYHVWYKIWQAFNRKCRPMYKNDVLDANTICYTHRLLAMYPRHQNEQHRIICMACLFIADAIHSLYPQYWTSKELISFFRREDAVSVFISQVAEIFRRLNGPKQLYWTTECDFLSFLLYELPAHKQEIIIGRVVRSIQAFDARFIALIKPDVLPLDVAKQWLKEIVPCII